MKQTQQCLILYLLYLCIFNDNNREKLLNTFIYA